ncbi:hypothetical protein E2C01_057842 [Portunus trituberculatus]|uniref:Uncharacterized protein n=1 Tax=Portunus trituberculatus TaxID=210409 RepID=A0A5B7GUL5_PORTR|nr:hypothetical protein [Portunus trituberculatus]
MLEGAESFEGWRMRNLIPHAISLTTSPRGLSDTAPPPRSRRQPPTTPSGLPTPARRHTAARHIQGGKRAARGRLEGCKTSGIGRRRDEVQRNTAEMSGSGQDQGLGRGPVFPCVLRGGRSEGPRPG